MPLIPWSESAPAFNTQELSAEDISVKNNFSLPHIIYIGSHEGCSCGFMKAVKWNKREVSKREKTIQDLCEYLRNALHRSNSLEMYLCWEGQQHISPVQIKQLSINQLLLPEFPIGENELVHVVT